MRPINTPRKPDPLDDLFGMGNPMPGENLGLEPDGLGLEDPVEDPSMDEPEMVEESQGLEGLEGLEGPEDPETLDAFDSLFAASGPVNPPVPGTSPPTPPLFKPATSFSKGRPTPSQFLRH